VATLTGSTIAITDTEISSYRLNRSYDFVSVHDAREEQSIITGIESHEEHGQSTQPEELQTGTITEMNTQRTEKTQTITMMSRDNDLRRPHTFEIFVSCRNVAEIVQCYNFFGKAGLATLCDFMEPKVKYKKRSSIKAMILSLIVACTSDSSTRKSPVLVFRERNHPRNLNIADSLRVWTIEALQCDAQASRLKHNITMANRRRIRQTAAHNVLEQAQHGNNSSLLSEMITSKFPAKLSEQCRNKFISQWQQLGADAYREKGCAVCGRAMCESQISLLHADNLDLTLLRNSDITNDVRLVPKLYDFAAYDEAILYHGGLITPERRGYLQICNNCKQSLVHKKKQPLDAWANYHYYALECLPDKVMLCLQALSDFDKMMISRARASKITHVYDEKKGFYNEEGTSGRFSKVNVGILPQETVVLRHILPPNHKEIEESACAIFINSTTQIDRNNISKHHPVLVSKTNVKTLLEFLTQNNMGYSEESGLTVSQANLDSLYTGDDQAADLPPSTEIRSLDQISGEQKGAGKVSDYSVSESLSSKPDECEIVPDVIMEAVGYTTGDFSHGSYKYMKGVALDAILSGKKFIQVRTGTDFIDDEDFLFLTSAFLHLDPWGIGGFNNPKRDDNQKVSFECQLKNMLQQHNRHFVKDPNFAYVCWNILQKREMRKCIAFKTSECRRQKVTDELLQIQPALQSMIQKWKTRPWAPPATEMEQRAVKLLSMVRMTSREVEGTAGYKQCRQNEIHSLMKKFGTPALFITLTPDDKTNEIAGALGGFTNEEWYMMSEIDRKIFIAESPDIAARAFDITIRKFLDIILQPKDGEPGAFGRCSAYYGMVEAQGRGMLHCHFLIWLEGNPNPQRLREMMEADSGFRDQMFDWLESTIKCQLPGDMEPVSELNGPLPRPLARCQAEDVRFERPPHIDELSPEEFNDVYNSNVRRLVQEFNWHEHRETCWKHLLPGEPRDDSTCRMRINGSTNPKTFVNKESGSIILKRLHPRISNYNELLTFLIRSNTDIKYIGSGEAAKALVFYITDYITKAELPVHEGLDAIQVAMEKTEKQYGGDSVSSDTRSKSLFIKSLNAIMGRTEVSHQQVMSYLVGGGDVYSSHQFRTLIWSDVEQHLLTQMGDDIKEHSELNIEANAGDEPEVVIYGEEMVKIDVDVGKRISTSNVVRDYVLHDTKPEFETLCLYDYIARAYKVKNGVKAALDEVCASLDKIGRLSEGHPQRLTHVVHVRCADSDADNFVPVILGRRFPRPDQGEEQKEEWCRSMLALFKPWRLKDDLKWAGESWSAAFERAEFLTKHHQIMSNIHVENECRDARDSHSAAYHRQQQHGRVLRDGNIEARFISDIMRENDDECEGVTHIDEWDDDESSEYEKLWNQGDDYSSELCWILSASGILASRGKACVLNMNVHESEVMPSDATDLHAQQVVMEKYRRQKQPAVPDSYPNKHRKLNDGSVAPETTITQLSLDNAVVHNIEPRHQTSKSEMRKIVNSIIEEYTMSDNEEQERALRIVAEHFISGTEDQLLMYVGGMGGTGKSHVIDAIIQLFEQCGYSERLLVSAPTGCAAVIIKGYTIHALTFLPSGKVRVKQEDLEQIWRNVKYLIIDEISIVSAYFFAQISEQISKAKGVYDKVCGGISVVCFGDLGQLPPVGSLPLFSHELVERLSPRIKETHRGQRALCGAFMWRQIKNVVLLKKNQRAKKDPKFANMLNQIRLGQAWDGRADMTDIQRGTGVNYNEPDDVTLKKRDLCLLLKTDEAAKEKFKMAPIIVANQKERDQVNVMKVQQFADSVDEDVHQYHSKDSCRKVPLEGTVQERVWMVPSTRTGDALGKLPLVPGMKVMITENIAMLARVVNGIEGHLVSIKWEMDELHRRYARCAYVEIKGSNVKFDGLEPDVVPIFPVKTYFKFSGSQGEYPIVREQLPLVPAYAFTDYKSQGKTLEAAIVDINGCKTLQNVYVMLSRCRRLEDLAVVRGVPSKKIYTRLSEEFRKEFWRLEARDRQTKSWYEKGLRGWDNINSDSFLGV
jgi:hypothetical protein